MKHLLSAKRTFLLLIITCLIPLLASTPLANDWKRQQIDQRLSVEFPIVPVHKSGYGSLLYNSILPDAAYIVAAIHYNKQPHLRPITEPYTYYLSMLNSSLRDFKGTMVDSSTFEVDNYKGLQYAFSALHPGGKRKLIRTKRVLFVEGWVYQVEYMPLTAVTSKDGPVNMKKFFDSMRLTNM
ncbi:hypothetical protein [Rufibacter sp. LB8]|uniref:hypothetical protein n=1 Tax=Rufibacter sp. LB8 TaxID=2777781 RepID=UPI00178C3AB4|nr:hypothetical protein [Rufibacter sp. LB8]